MRNGTDDVVVELTQRWQRDPFSAVAGSGVAAALWQQAGRGTAEVCGGPSHRHCIAVPLCAWDLELFQDGRRVHAGTVRPGTMQITRSSDEPRAVNFGRWSVLHLYVDEHHLARLAEAEFGPSPALELIDPGFRRDAVVAQIAQEIVAEMHAGLPFSRLRIEALGQELCVQLLREHSNLRAAVKRATQRTKGSLSAWQLRRATELMLDDLARDIGLAEIARELNMTPQHFCRAFKATVGQPPQSWHAERRLQRAKEMLQATQLPVSYIACEVGYSSPSAFATAFGRRMGVPPAAWRAAHRT